LLRNIHFLLTHLKSFNSFFVLKNNQLSGGSRILKKMDNLGSQSV
jgi:hypothetical protein